MSPRARVRLATEVVDDFRRIVQVLRSSARRAERDLGVSGAQLFVLQKLAEAPAESLNALAERTLTHQSSVSVVVARLVKRGLVTRARSPEDGRRVEFSMSPAGKRLLRRSPIVPQLQLVDAVLLLRPGDLQLLARLLRVLVDAMGGSRMLPVMFGENPGTPAARRRGLKRVTGSA
jgi:MarR family transcriptional regulator, lower aerobic nicotinate degradation pathway regulator